MVRCATPRLPPRVSDCHSTRVFIPNCVVKSSRRLIQRIDFNWERLRWRQPPELSHLQDHRSPLPGLIIVDDVLEAVDATVTSTTSASSSVEVSDASASLALATVSRTDLEVETTRVEHAAGLWPWLKIHQSCKPMQTR